MADAAISDLDPITLIQDSDLFILEQNGVAMKLLGSLLKNYIDRNILSVSAQSLDPTESARVISFDAQTGELVVGIPSGTGIANITKTGTAGLIDTYTITFETPYGGEPRAPITFTVRNGLDGAGSVSSVDSVHPDEDGNVELNAYVKPSGGIPASDLASSVQDSLSLADSSVQDVSGLIPKSAQAEKTAAMTQAVGVDSNGKLWILGLQTGSKSQTVRITAAAVVADVSISFNPPTGFKVGAVASIWYDSNAMTQGWRIENNTVEVYMVNTFGYDASGTLTVQVLYIPA